MTEEPSWTDHTMDSRSRADAVHWRRSERITITILLARTVLLQMPLQVSLLVDLSEKDRSRRHAVLCVFVSSYLILLVVAYHREILGYVTALSLFVPGLVPKLCTLIADAGGHTRRRPSAASATPSAGHRDVGTTGASLVRPPHPFHCAGRSRSARPRPLLSPPSIHLCAHSRWATFPPFFSPPPTLDHVHKTPNHGVHPPWRRRRPWRRLWRPRRRASKKLVIFSRD